MKEPLKIVLVGAGSRSFAPGVIHDLVLETELSGRFDVELALVDLDPARLEQMLLYGRNCAAFKKSPVRFSATTDRVAALRDAAFVIVSVAVNRMALWEQDYRVGIACGIEHIYGENGGPGAIFHALRNYQLILPLCRDIERIAPQAVVFNFTNPESRILSAILTLTKLKAYGLCHGFYGFYQTVEKILGRPVAELDVRTAGMNHFFTYYRIAERATGRDLIPEFVAGFRRREDEFDGVTRYLFDRFGVVGYPHGTHTGEYVAGAVELEGGGWSRGIESRPVPRNEVAEVNEYLEYIENRRPVDDKQLTSSGELAIPMIGDLMLKREAFRPAVNVLNDRLYIPNLAADGCIEVPARVRDGEIMPETVPPLAEGFAAQIRLQHSIQKLLLEAYVGRSRELLLQAILLDPVVKSPRSAELYLKRMFELQAEYLPEFR